MRGRLLHVCFHPMKVLTVLGLVILSSISAFAGNKSQVPGSRDGAYVGSTGSKSPPLSHGEIDPVEIVTELLFDRLRLAQCRLRFFNLKTEVRASKKASFCPKRL